MKSFKLFALLVLAVMLTFLWARQVSAEKNQRKEAKIIGTPYPNHFPTTVKGLNTEEEKEDENVKTPYPNHFPTTVKGQTTEDEIVKTPYPNHFPTTVKGLNTEEEKEDENVKTPNPKQFATTLKKPTKQAIRCKPCYLFRVTIDSAMVRDSDNVPFSSGSDVFVEVYANGLKIKKTETVSDNNNPRWSDQSFKINVCEDTELKFDLYDYDVFPKTENDYLGSAYMNYNDFVKSSSKTKRLPLQRAQDYLMVSFYKA